MVMKGSPCDVRSPKTEIRRSEEPDPIITLLFGLPGKIGVSNRLDLLRRGRRSSCSDFAVMENGPPPTISSHSAKPSNWRNATRARKSSFLSPARPPPPANDNWRSGSYSSRKTHTLGIEDRDLAEWVSEKCPPGQLQTPVARRLASHK
jgi:hypothetical protein